MVERIQRVIDTLQSLNIRSTYENMNALLGSIQYLIEIRDDLANQQSGNDAPIPEGLHLVQMDENGHPVEPQAEVKPDSEPDTEADPEVQTFGGQK